MSTVTPKAIWRMSNVLVQKAAFECAAPGHGSWTYVSSESPRHEEKVKAWLASRLISPNTSVYLVRGPDHIDPLTWAEVTEHWPRYLASEDARIVDPEFSWIIDYRKECIARFGRMEGRESSNQARQATAASRLDSDRPR